MAQREKKKNPFSERQKSISKTVNQAALAMTRRGEPENTLPCY